MLLYIMYFLSIFMVILHWSGTLAKLNIEWATFASAMGLLLVNVIDVMQTYILS